ncbi:MAG: helix-turn-helix transcriptional regulator [Thermodesulfobacteriota bacterium]
MKPGLKIAITDYYLHPEIELNGEFSQTTLAFTLTIEGSWDGSVRDRRGASPVLHVKPGLNVATIGPPQEYRLKIKGGQSHKSVRVEITEPFLSTMFDGTDMDQLAERILTPSESRRLLVHRNLSPALQCVAHQLINCPMHTGARRLFLESKVLEIVAHHLEAISDTPERRHILPDPGDVERLQKARSILEEEFADPPSLFVLARRVGLNDFKLKRGFKAIFGTTVFEYVRRLRMDKARALLEIGDINVTQAAVEAGYSSFGHFAAAFKKRFGTLPSRYCRGRRTFSAPRN